MARTLRDPTPTSSVARLLDREVAARAMAPRPEQSTLHSTERRQMHPPVDTTTSSPQLIKREFILTEAADDTFTRLLMLYRRATQTRMTASHLLRAMMISVSHCFASLEHAARKMSQERLPPNGPAFEVQRAAFERRVAEALVSGIRSAAALDAAAPEAAPTRDQPGR